MKSFGKIVIDCELVFVINFITVYLLLFVFENSSVGMISAIGVCIVAWRGGLLAGLIVCPIIQISTFLTFITPPFNLETLPMQWYLGNKIPGVIIGSLQCLFSALIVGYISNLVHKLRDEITLRKKTQKELEERIGELDSFGRTLAHDLKNPLMVINSSIEMLEYQFESVLTDPNVNKTLSYVKGSSKHMIDIIESILILAGLKKIKETEFKYFPVSQTIEEALKRLQYNIVTNKVQIINPGEWPFIKGYAPWITEVWVNYISNAIKYGGDPSRQISPVIELGYEVNKASQGSVKFWVKDNGEGIPKDKSDSLFKEFSRLHTNNYYGNGLGLSIVKEIVQRFNGTVGVDCLEERGSRFYFTIPFSMIKS